MLVTKAKALITFIMVGVAVHQVSIHVGIFRRAWNKHRHPINAVLAIVSGSSRVTASISSSKMQAKLIVAFRHRENHCIAHGASIKLSWAYQIAYILQDNQVNILQSPKLFTP